MILKCTYTNILLTYMIYQKYRLGKNDSNLHTLYAYLPRLHSN